MLSRRPLGLPRSAASARSRGRARGDNGVSVVTVLAITAAVFAAGAGILQVAAHQVQGSTFDRRRQQAFDAAEAGLTAAAARLASDDSVDWTIAGELPDGSASYSVTVSDVIGTTDTRRLLEAVGYAPADEPIVQRRIEQVVTLESIDAFEFGLFGGADGVTVGQDPLVVQGSVYSALDLALPPDTVVAGDVVSGGGVSTETHTIVAGAIRSGGAVDLGDSTTTVQGGVTAVGDAVVDATVSGDVVAGGAITGSGTVAGAKAPSANPPAPPAWEIPAFDTGSYSPTVTKSAATSDVSLGCTDLSTTARIRVTGTHDTIISGSCNLPSGSTVMVVADGPVAISGRFGTSSGAATLAVVTPDGGAISVDGGTTFTASVTALLLADGAPVSFAAGGHRTELTGAVYGSSLDVANDLRVTWAAIAADVTSQFTWTDAAPARFSVVAREFREVAAG